MLISHELTHTPRAFLAATGLTLDELEQLLPALQMADEHKDPPPLTQEGQSRQRPRVGGRAGVAHPGHGRGGKPPSSPSGSLSRPSPCQRCTACPLGCVPPPHAWLPRRLPVFPQAGRDLGEAPARAAGRGATRELARP